MSPLTGILFTCLLCAASLSAQAGTTYKVAVRTHSGVETGLAQWQPTLDYLNKSLPDQRFEMVPYPKLADQLEDARQQRFQFLLTNPATYVEIKHAVGARALVTLINKRHDSAQSQFGSVIFTRADRDDILDIHDLKDKHLMAVSPLAFGGWRLAWYEMLQRSFDPHKDLGRLSFAGGHQPSVVTAVQTGQADAGVVRTDMLERLESRGQINLTEFRIIHNRESVGFPFFHSTPLYPEWPLAVMPGVPESISIRVQQALLNISAEHPAAQQGHYIGWIAALDYQPVDDLLKALAIGPYQEQPVVTFNYHYLYPVGLLILLVLIIFSVKKPVQRDHSSSGNE